MRLAIDIFGDEDLRDELDDVGGRARNLKPAFGAILRFILVPRFRARFGGAGWPALAESTVERKAKQGLDPRVLRATGALEAALTSFGRTRNRLQTVGKSTVRVGVGKRLFYARFQHFGTDTIPSRELFGWEQADRTKALKLIDRHVFGGGKLL